MPKPNHSPTHTVYSYTLAVPGSSLIIHNSLSYTSTCVARTYQRTSHCHIHHITSILYCITLSHHPPHHLTSPHLTISPPLTSPHLPSPHYLISPPLTSPHLPSPHYLISPPLTSSHLPSPHLTISPNTQVSQPQHSTSTSYVPHTPTYPLKIIASPDHTCH